MCILNGIINSSETICKWIFKCLCNPFCTIISLFLEICLWIRNYVLMRCVGFFGGFALGQLYYTYMLKDIPFPYNIGSILSWSISLTIGIGNAICRQLRCITLLVLPMFCGKPGRSVLKAVVLSYVIAGPITNMGLNAKEVVRVFACSTQLTYNLSKIKHEILREPFKQAVFQLKDDVNNVRNTLSSIADVVDPIEREIEDAQEVGIRRKESNYIDHKFVAPLRSEAIEKKYKMFPNETEEERYNKMYNKKIEYRCQDQVTQAVALCSKAFEGAYERCSRGRQMAAKILCWPVEIQYICNLMHVIGPAEVCDSKKEANPGLGKGYFYLKKAKREITKNLYGVNIQHKIDKAVLMHNIQDAKDTGERVLHAFEEKHIIMQKVIDAVNICVALLFIRIILAAGTYHDLYLTSIGYDNVYITSYFKRLDQRRREKNKTYLLPLKKMERNKYIDVHSTAYTIERNKIMAQILKVMLEMVTATTFVMLDRLFYEALDVVRKHAMADGPVDAELDLNIKVDGKGFIAKLVRTMLIGLKKRNRLGFTVSNQPCLPRPRSMPPIFFLKIYGGYIFILLLLYFNAYTLRLRRLFCSWFYPRREKQRILHLYNDILKKRLKMQKTLRRKAVQAMRAHYLSAENLLSLRIKFPQLLGWLKIFPAARMTCLICGETEPGNNNHSWHLTCSSARCPFVYCGECWREVAERCLACDPSLVEMSDVDSLSEDEKPRY